MSWPKSFEEIGGEVRFLEREEGVHLRYALFRKPGAKRRALLLPGFTEFIEKYLETARDLQNRGYDVLCLDWRGQGLSSRLLPDRHKGHILSMDQHLEDMFAVMEEAGFGDGAPLLLVGHSMGGHMAVRALMDRASRFDKAVLSAPMIDIVPKGPLGFSARQLSRLICFFGQSRHYVFKGKGYGEHRRTFYGNRLTSDPDRFRRGVDFVLENPDLALGDPTFGWVKAALRSIDWIRGGGRYEALATPCLVLQAGKESIVQNWAIDEMVERLPNGRLVELPEARHEIFCENDAIRSDVWKAIDGFLNDASEA